MAEIHTNGKWKISPSVIIWFVTTLVAISVAWANLATEDYVDQKVEKVEKKVDENYNKLDGKVDQILQHLLSEKKKK